MVDFFFVLHQDGILWYPCLDDMRYYMVEVLILSGDEAAVS